MKDHLLWVDAPRLHPDRRRADPDRRDPSRRGHAARLLREREIGDTRARPQPRARSRPRPQARRRPALSARAPGDALELWTDEPGLQLFDASAMTIEAPGHDGPELRPLRRLLPRGAAFPRQPAPPEWPSIVATPETPRISSGWWWRSPTRPDGPGVRARTSKRLTGKRNRAAVNGCGTALTARRKPMIPQVFQLRRESKVNQPLCRLGCQLQYVGSTPQKTVATRIRSAFL